MDHSSNQPAALDAMQVPGLRVALVALAPAEAMFHPEAMPAPAPLDDERPHPLPAHLPAGLLARRLGEAYCAVDASGRFQATWIELHLPPAATLSLPWNLDDGPAPAMQGFRLRGRDAIAIGASWSMVSAERLPVVITRASPDSCWIVGGRLPIEELARIAVSLPGGAYPTHR
ncbi:MAG: hypothetical protein HGA45_32595 [Chloroflexales bacterium]|nr:hypothetical protein [Chloroflexales bacterium]